MKSLAAMPQFRSWSSYRRFARSVKGRYRYVRDPETEEFLGTVLATSASRKESISQGALLWRAQLGHGWDPMYEEGDVPCPFPPKRMKPVQGQATEGRANPKGIPYLYLSTKRDTALSEVRPWLGSLISVGQFTTLRDLVVINCTTEGRRTGAYLRQPSPEKREHAVWSDIDKAFSTPVTLNDQMADYVPTQIIAELFKCNGFDGIAYRSALGEGHNVVLFDLNAAELTNCSLCEAKKITFEFKQSANPYFVTKRVGKAVK